MDPFVLSVILQFPHHAPWILFAAMVLTGLNLPISEDIMLLTGGIMASTFVPGLKLEIWLALFLGAYIADSLAYWTGRLIGPKLLKSRWTGQFITQARLDKVHGFYERWGFWSFTVGRFIPFGVRNCLFISAGMGTLPYKKFVFIDGAAALISTTTGFLVAYTLGKAFGHHFQVLFEYLKKLDVVMILVAAAATVVILGFLWYKTTKKKALNHDEKSTSKGEQVPGE